MITDALAPGDVVIHRLHAAKHRPWLVLWVDDVESTCLLAAFTNSGLAGKSDIKLAVPEGFGYGTIGVWAMKWPLEHIRPSYAYRYPEITPAVVEQARRSIAKEMDL